MISIGYLFEFEGLHSLEMRERLENVAANYYKKANVPGLDKEHKRKLTLMGDRADSLSGRLYDFRYNNDDTEYRDRYRKATDKLYPQRLEKRRENAIKLLPLSLRK